jgi:Xaa-Pro aminopeptidase
LQALQAGLAAIRPGVTAGAVALAQNEVFRAQGLGEYTTSQYTRVRGHGLGLYVDTAPPILEGDATLFEAGMTVIVHPNGYHPDSGYLVLGDALVVREGGNEILTRTPRQLFSV